MIFRLPSTPPFPHHLHNDDDAVDGDTVKGLQHGLPVEPEPEPEPELELANPLGFH